MGIKGSGGAANMVEDLPVGHVLNMALGKIAQNPGVVVIGRTTEGELYVAGSNRDHRQVAALVREGMGFLDEIVDAKS